jgi:hypothetical protein
VGVKYFNLNAKNTLLAKLCLVIINKVEYEAVRALCSALLTKYLSGDQVKKTEMGRTCGTYGGEERCIQGFSGKT